MKTCTMLSYKLSLFGDEILYKLQLIQPILYDLQPVQTACTSCNFYRLFVQVASCTKSQLVHHIHKLIKKNSCAIRSKWQK